MKTGDQIVQELPWKWGVQGRIFIIGGLGYLFDAWDIALNGFLMPLLSKDFGLTVGESGLVATANLVGMAVGAVVWGAIADRIGRKRAFSATLLIFAVFSVLGALSPDYSVFLVLRFLAGVGLGGCIPVDYALVSEFSPRKHRGRILTALDLWWPVGVTLCGLAATLMIPLPGNWRWMLATMVLPALLLFWVRRGVPESPIYLTRVGREAEARQVIDSLVARTGAVPEPYEIPVPAAGEGSDRPKGLRAGYEQFRRLWKFNPRITSVCWLLFVTIMLVYYAALTWMPSILKEEGYDDTASFMGPTLMSGVGILGVLASTWLVEITGRKWLIGVSAPLSTAALVGFALVLKVETAAMAAIAVFGFLIQLTIPVLYAYAAELYPTTLRASGFGWASSVSRISTGFAPMLFGSLMWPLLGLPMTFTVLGVVVVLAVVWMAFGAPETKGKDLDDVDEEPVLEQVTVPPPAEKTPVQG
ncbi:MFS transporter [Streptomyces abyssalis]|uniref:MFS transporter n=1 Tax=Streptomyces abyssalis TaxID=933944 RepID=A0A1E7JHZ1_9ACTN|nr:MFS transporter [Streptomyces abyssalis]OEU86088.1 MFS transporter [Streptomyces abyssalis]OEU92446.1 MFS transporter [Streptomyces abyssalis]OEV26494.1 MFS transporter [Streptomyces nanshensis]